ncbi:M3 family metallopeptidase [Psychrobium sp. 1_MG-2023]|uniref:M3 family metallopeptidase n=1 Tax=Psychrobium sp. 1_MG-2023 TaxID=3062624 RepID=UPI0026B2B13F|nr:M3 family metallopeptidase [Psychrobium sp. 1_MG-2023]MDP2561402.1 M3 family metallopeptidase [Psychrobium sp. 1_MG-2023]
MKKVLATAISSILLMSGCSEPSQTAAPTQAQQASSVDAQIINPLFTRSALQYQTPNFDQIKDEHFLPAFEKGIAEQMAEIKAIADNKAAPTFENTIVAMEKSGELLTRAQRVFYNLVGTDSNPQRRAIQKEMAPKLAVHGDNISLNKDLFKRIETIYQQRNSLDLTAEEVRLIDVYYKQFIRAGARLNETQQQRIREINKELSNLGTQFSQNIMALIKSNVVLVKDKAQLAGLSDTQLAHLAKAATEAGHDGQYLIKITNTTRQPILAALENRDLREKIWRASAERALSGENSNRDVVPSIANLRSERAGLLGYDSYAHFGLESQMAKEPQAVLDMLTSMVPSLLDNVENESAAIQAKIDASGSNFKLEPWDWFYYAEQVRKEKYNLDENEVKEYFEFNRVLEDGVFFTMNRLYGISFKPRPDLPVYHANVKAYELLDEDGTSLAIFYADYFAREGKRGGAWKSAFVKQSGLDNQRPVIVNVMNIQKAPEGKKTLISYSEATTIFHEMGHGIHGMLSQVKYPTLSGTSTSRDYVEFPSTFEEDWAMHPEVIANYAKHYQTGEAIPKALLDKVIASRSFNQGFDTFEYIAAALVDMEWHSLPSSAGKQDIVEFEKQALKKHNVDVSFIPPRYKSAYFAHAMGGYAAGYYAYMWSEILAADAFAYVQTQGGLDRKIGQKYRENILEVGNTRDLMESYKAFRGQAPTTDALLKRRGINVSTK